MLWQRQLLWWTHHDYIGSSYRVRLAVTDTTTHAVPALLECWSTTQNKIAPLANFFQRLTLSKLVVAASVRSFSTKFFQNFLKILDYQLIIQDFRLKIQVFQNILRNLDYQIENLGLSNWKSWIFDAKCPIIRNTWIINW